MRLAIAVINGWTSRAASGPNDGQDQHVRGGQRAELGVDAGGHRQPGDDDVELAARHQRDARPAAGPARAMPARRRRPVSRSRSSSRCLTTASSDRQHRPPAACSPGRCAGRRRRRRPPRTGPAAGRAVRLGVVRELARTARCRPGTRPTAADTWSCWAMPGHQQRQPEHLEQQHLGVWRWRRTPRRQRPKRSATSRTTLTVASAMASVIAPADAARRRPAGRSGCGR